MKNLKSIELNYEELMNISGGGWIADFVEGLLCSCNERPQHSIRAQVRAREMASR